MRAPVRLGLAVALCAWLPSCGKEPTKPSPKPSALKPDTVVLRFGDIEITDGELNAFVSFSQKTDPTLAPAFIRRVTLIDYLIPKKLAWRMAPKAEFESARRKAEDLANAVERAGGTLEALRRFGSAVGGKEQTGFLPPFNRLPPDFSRAVFRVEIGGATGAIHGVYGSMVAGAIEERPPLPPSTVRERRIYAAYFPYSSNPTFKQDVIAAGHKLRAGVTYVHPEYEDEFESVFRRKQ